MNIFLAFLCYIQILSNNPKEFSTVLNYLKSDTRSVAIANINCSIECNTEAYFCDTIAINQNQSPAKTLELPLQYLSNADIKKLVKVFVDTYTYSGVYYNKKTKITDVKGHCNCMYNPTIALLFKNSDSVIFAQILLDLNHNYCVIYYWVDGRYKACANSDNFAIELYATSGLIEIAKKYNLKCLTVY